LIACASPASRAAALIGVGERGERAVLVHEAVDDPARLAPAEGAGQPRRALRGQRVAMRGRGAGLRRQHQGAPDLGSHCAGAEDGGDRRPVGDSAGRHEREFDGAGDQAQRSEQAKLLALWVVAEVAAVAAGFKALHDQSVGSSGAGLLGLAPIGDRDPDVAVRRMQAGDDVRFGAAERERDDLDPLGDQQLELGREVVIVVARLAELDAEGVGLALQPLGVRRDRRAIGERCRRSEDVHAERRVARRAQLADVVAHRGGCLVASGEEAEPAGGADGRRQPRRRGAARQRRLHDRLAKPGEVDPGCAAARRARSGRAHRAPLRSRSE
jgi:hypothetical protein